MPMVEAPERTKTTPAIQPRVEPEISPDRRLSPERICDDQKERIVRRVIGK